MNIPFSHEEESIHEALGVNKKEFAEKLGECLRDFFTNTDNPNLSKLSEKLQSTMNDNELLLLATNEILNKLDDMEDDILTMEKMFKNLFNAN
jgi:uncharacterized protein (DUF2164 family)